MEEKTKYIAGVDPINNEPSIIILKGRDGQQHIGVYKDKTKDYISAIEQMQKFQLMYNLYWNRMERFIEKNRNKLIEHEWRIWNDPYKYLFNEGKQEVWDGIS